MDLVFDLEEDELHIFLAEADEHLQTLDEGLVRLEREGNDLELLQAIFRAAHTLKGAAGTIGHQRMAELTHAMETVLDGLRKRTLAVSADLVDVCLESLDALRLLRNEVIERRASPVDIAPLVERLSRLAAPTPTEGNGPQTDGKQQATGDDPSPVVHPPSSPVYTISADIAPDSFASAARAFQVLLALQSLGDVLDVQPPQAVIETAAPVQRITARLATSHSPDDIRQALADIPEITNVTVNGEPGAENRGTQGKLVGTPPSSPPPSEARGERMRGATPHTAEKTVRTSVERLDSLMNLVGELITDRNRLFQIRSNFEHRFRGDPQVEELIQTTLHISRITDQLQEEVMRIRMLPIANVFNKFPRLVRDLARKAGKQVELVIRGEETELDRSVIEEISDPLIHLLRNAVDHGLETPEERRAAGKSERGTILLTARHEESRIILTVEDDGRGIDVERVKASAVHKGLLTEAEAAALSHDEAIHLIFRPGLSTAKVVTDVSGRGVGMDIVRANIERLNGTITVETWPGQGTQFQITLPLTLAIIPTLLVRIGEGTFAIPLPAVMETLRVPLIDIQTVKGKQVIQLRQRVLPLVRLSQVLGFQTNPSPDSPPLTGKGEGGNGQRYEYVVAVRWGRLEMGLLVDALVGEQELVIKPLGRLIGETPGISGAAILGDGRVALIVDVPGLFKLVTEEESR
jgi:two-component system chemotaxis sensor kinase CheA